MSFWEASRGASILDSVAAIQYSAFAQLFKDGISVAARAIASFKPSLEATSIRDVSHRSRREVG